MKNEAKYRSHLKVCTQSGHTWEGMVDEKLRDEFSCLEVSGSLEREKQAAFKAWVFATYPNSGYADWTSARCVNTFTELGYYRLDSSFSEFISVLPIMVYPSKSSKVMPLHTLLKKCASLRTVWENKSRYTIREESRPSDEWMADARSDPAWAAPSTKSLKNSKAWHNGKTISKCDLLISKYTYCPYRNKAPQNYSDLWEYAITRSKGRYKSRWNYGHEAVNEDRGGIVAMRYSRGCKKLHSRDIDRLIEESLF